VSKQNPAYRGIYAYDADNKPAGTTPLTKAQPKYRGIYTYSADHKPDGNPATPPVPPGPVG
jgi:hypothetical protein